MPPRKRPVNDNPIVSNSEHTGPLENGIPNTNMQNQFQQMMQALLDQQCQANENQARLQEQMAKKDNDHAREMAQVQRQLLEVLERRPERVQAQPPGTQIVFNTWGNDPNDLYEGFEREVPRNSPGMKIHLL